MPEVKIALPPVSGDADRHCLRPTGRFTSGPGITRMPLNAIEFRLERELQFRIGGEHSTGKLFVGDVTWKEDKKQWACHWSLAHVHPEVACFYGADPLAAITATLDFLSILIRGSEDDGLVVWWQTEGDHAGLTFPLSEGKKWRETPPSMR